MLEVREKEYGVVALHPPTGPLKNNNIWGSSRYRDVNPVPTSQLADDTLETAPFWPVRSGQVRSVFNVHIQSKLS